MAADVFSVSTFIGIYGDRLQFRLVSCSRKYTKCSNFTLSFCRERLKNVQSFQFTARTEPLFCSLSILCHYVLVAVSACSRDFKPTTTATATATRTW